MNWLKNRKISNNELDEEESAKIAQQTENNSNNDFSICHCLICRSFAHTLRFILCRMFSIKAEKTQLNSTQRRTEWSSLKERKTFLSNRIYWLCVLFAYYFGPNWWALRHFRSLLLGGGECQESIRPYAERTNYYNILNEKLKHM